MSFFDSYPLKLPKILVGLTAKEQALSTNSVFVSPSTWTQPCYRTGVNIDMLCLVGLLIKGTSCCVSILSYVLPDIRRADA